MNNTYLMQNDYDYIDLQLPIYNLKQMIKVLKQDYGDLVDRGGLSIDVQYVFQKLLHESNHILKLLEFKVESQQKLDKKLERQIATFMSDNAFPAK